MRGLVDDWNASRQERTWMKPGERVHSIEGAIKGRMPTHRILDGLIPRRSESRWSGERYQQDPRSHGGRQR